MRENLEIYSTREGIRSSLLESEDELLDAEVVDASSRLSVPLNTAHKYVANAVSLIGGLKPAQRKEVSTKLIDIAESCLVAVTKSLKRSGSDDPKLTSQIKKISKLLQQFDDDYTSLVVSESTCSEEEDVEAIAFGTDEDGTPQKFEDTDDIETLDPLAVRVLADNSDSLDPSLGDGDPAEDSVAPPEGEASPETVDTSAAEDKIIDTLAAASDLPKEFKSTGENESIHQNTSHNLEILELLMK